MLLAGTNDTVDALNQRRPPRLIDRGVLAARPSARFAGRDFAVGDRVVLRRNSVPTPRTTAGDRTAVLNGQTGTVTGVATRPGSSCASTATAPIVHLADRLPRRRRHRPRLRPHQPPRPRRHLGPRHRRRRSTASTAKPPTSCSPAAATRTGWSLTAPELDDLDAELDRHDSGIPLPGEEPDDLDDDLTRRLNRSRAKLLALTHDPHADHDRHTSPTPSPSPTSKPGPRTPAPSNSTPPRPSACDPRPVAAQARPRRAHRHPRSPSARRVKAHDRHNIGTIVGLDDHAGTVTVHFIAPDGAQADRDLPWADVEIVDPRHPDPRTTPTRAAAALDAVLEPARHALDTWHAHLAAHGVGPLDAATLRTRRHPRHRPRRRPPRRRPTRLAHRPPRPPPRPADPPPHVWDDTVRDLAAHRTRHHIPDPATPTGPHPTDTTGVAIWHAAHPTIEQAQTWLATHTTRA